MSTAQPRLLATAGELDVDAAERLLRDGGLAVIPTDTVYGFGCAAYLAKACARLYEVKGRAGAQATALVLGSVDNLLGNVLPELLGRTGVQVRRLLPGPLTLVVANPGQRFAYVCGERPDRIGVRVPVLPPALALLADALGGFALTSANRPGEPAPAALDDVPDELLAAAAVIVDGGRLPGTASTVVDISEREIEVLRSGAVPAEEVQRRLGAPP